MREERKRREWEEREIEWGERETGGKRECEVREGEGDCEVREGKKEETL